MATQANAAEVGAEGDAFRAAADEVFETPPIEEVVTIGNRRTILIRCAQGGWLGD
jgi:hypothetical protein